VRYRDRAEAGRWLAASIKSAGIDLGDHPLVLGIARGGLPVAAQLAKYFHGELDVAVACKIGSPGNPEFAIGAVAAGGDPVLSRDVIEALNISSDELAVVIRRAQSEVKHRIGQYRSMRSFPDIKNRVVIVVDDGVATGFTLRATLRSIRDAGPELLICAVPVGPSDTVSALRAEADWVVCPYQPSDFHAVGIWYEDFSQLNDVQVIGMLDER